MSNPMDYLLSNVPDIAGLQKVKAETAEARIVEAMERMQVAVSDTYENISVFSLYWESDDTGGKEDSTLFNDTISNLQNVQKCQQSLSADVDEIGLLTEIRRAAASQPGSRKLFILHYAGHAIAGSTPDKLIITPKLDQALGTGPEINMTFIKDGLKMICSKVSGLDVLLVMDSCCAAISGRGRMTMGARMELMAATSRKGVSNARTDGRSFTEHWCEAFTELLKTGEPFTCLDIIKELIPDSELEQFPSMFVLREGCQDLPITFRLRPCPIESTVPAAVTSRTVIMAFHVEENPNSPLLKHLIDYLNKAPVPITVLAVLPISNTLLLLRVPVFLRELIVLPRVAVVLVA